jgi:hypothetical protein
MVRINIPASKERHCSNAPMGRRFSDGKKSRLQVKAATTFCVLAYLGLETETRKTLVELGQLAS